jgi:hypothetical protein
MAGAARLGLASNGVVVGRQGRRARRQQRGGERADRGAAREAQRWYVTRKIAPT